MNFLTPLFLFGALAVALPVLFHLIRRTSRDKTPFSSLMFLLPTPPRVTRRSRLENLWLLLLRCLVLCLLALGFARPFFPKQAAADPQSGPGTRLVLLVDTSASMQRGDLWVEARARVESILMKVSPADQVALFTFNRQVKRLVSFEQWSAMALAERSALTAKRLQEVTPGWSGTHLDNALITAAEAFEESGKQDENRSPRKIVLISDLQEGSRLEKLQGYEWPRGVEVIIELLKTKRPTNAGLQLVTERTDTDKSVVEAEPKVRVSNSTDSKREQFQVGWASADGKSFGSAAVDAYVPPGQSRIFQAPKLPAGLPGECLALAGDDEAFDNTVYTVPPRAEQIKILFFGNDSEKDPEQSLYYVKRAFQQTQRLNVQIIAHSENAPLLASNTAAASLLIVTDTLPEEQMASVKKLLAEGKTVLLSLKNAAAAQNLVRLLDIGSIEAEEAVTSGYAMLGQIDFENPLFAPFADPRFSDFTKIHFWKYRRLSLDKLPNARVLARFEKGDPAMFQLPVGRGTLLVLTSGWNPADSQLALSSKFVPLLYSILEQSGGIQAQRFQFTVGDEVAIPVATNSPALTIRKPNGSEESLVAGEKFTHTDWPGIYTVTSTQPPIRFAVNLAPEESKTAPLSLEELERLGLPLKREVVANTARAEQTKLHLQAAELESRQKLWRWLIVGALVLLIMETWLAGWLTRRGTVETEAQT